MYHIEIIHILFFQYLGWTGHTFARAQGCRRVRSGRGPNKKGQEPIKIDQLAAAGPRVRRENPSPDENTGNDQHGQRGQDCEIDGHASIGNPGGLPVVRIQTAPGKIGPIFVEP